MRAVVQRVAEARVSGDGEPLGQVGAGLCVLDTGGAILLVSQFTLIDDTSAGNRPSFSTAARPEQAEPLYELVATELRALGVSVETGRFGAHMDVALVNDGPVTIVLDL